LADVVDRGWDVAECVGTARNGEVVHLIIHDNSGFGDHQLRAEQKVDSTREGNRHTRGISRHHMGCTMSGIELVGSQNMFRGLP